MRRHFANISMTTNSEHVTLNVFGVHIGCHLGFRSLPKRDFRGLLVCCFGHLFLSFLKFSACYHVLPPQT